MDPEESAHFEALRRSGTRLKKSMKELILSKIQGPMFFEVNSTDSKVQTKSPFEASTQD